MHKTAHFLANFPQNCSFCHIVWQERKILVNDKFFYRHSWLCWSPVCILHYMNSSRLPACSHSSVHILRSFQMGRDIRPHLERESCFVWPTWVTLHDQICWIEHGSNLNWTYLERLPKQEWASFASSKPFPQEHTYPPSVSLQFCSQCPLLILHSSMSATGNISDSCEEASVLNGGACNQCGICINGTISKPCHVLSKLTDAFVSITGELVSLLTITPVASMCVHADLGAQMIVQRTFVNIWNVRCFGSCPAFPDFFFRMKLLFLVGSICFKGKVFVPQRCVSPLQECLSLSSKKPVLHKHSYLLPCICLQIWSHPPFPSSQGLASVERKDASQCWQENLQHVFRLVPLLPLPFPCNENSSQRNLEMPSTESEHKPANLKFMFAETCSCIYK